MQRDPSAPPSSAPSTSNSAVGAGQQAPGSGVPVKSKMRRRARPGTRRKPSISQVVLGVLAAKGAHSRVSLATLKRALTTTGYNMTRIACRFKKVLAGLVDKGVLKQVTSKGTSSTFCMGKKQASKFKREADRWRQQRQRRFLLSTRLRHKPLKRGRRRLAKRR